MASLALPPEPNMTSKDLSKQLDDLRVEDLLIDHLGRIVIDNPTLTNILREQGTFRPARAAIDNVGCCENLAKCGKLTADEVTIRERLVSGRLGQEK